ncbi:MAG: AAA family ATPase [Geobacteraceae bacterium]|nr:AAA family ATPase [Geobacteraceae bacterium]
MKFFVQSYIQRPQYISNDPIVILRKDNWNDYSYMTLNHVFVFLPGNEDAEELGYVKIMYKGQKEKQWVFQDGPTQFDMLDETYCSLSTNIDFYKGLKSIGYDFAIAFMTAIRDAAFFPKIWKAFQEDPCFQTSLLRNSSSAIEIRDTLPSLFGRERKKVRQFTYSVQLPGAENEHNISFNFKKSDVPFRINLLVGPNGSGKTQLLSKLAIALSGVTQEETSAQWDAAREKRLGSGRVSPIPSFYQVIAISFNAFDKFEIPVVEKDGETNAPPGSNNENTIRYTYCGIRNENGTLCSEKDLAERIAESISKLTEDKLETLTDLWHKATGQSNIPLHNDNAIKYEYLSSGQKIVLNIITHLLVHLLPNSLVLIDEPETHLHPSLMTMLVNELGDLLKTYRSYAIVATHSPLIAQQIPSEYIKVINRNDGYVEIYAPDIECFGANISEITNSLLTSREYERDYTKTLDGLVEKFSNDATKVEALFPQGLGINAKLYLSSSIGGKQ